METAQPPSPDEELAALIARRLIEAGLIEADRRDEVIERIASGKARAEDWRLWVDVALAHRAG